MVHSVRYALVLLLAMFCVAGCSGTSGGNTDAGASTVAHLPSGLKALSATGAVAGATGKLRLTFENPLPEDTVVTMKSAQPSIVDMAAQVTAPKGSVVADFEYQAKLVGDAIVYATLGDNTRSARATVVDKVRLTAMDLHDERLEVGATSSLAIFLNIDPASPVTIDISSDDTTVVSAPSTLVISPFWSEGRYYGDNNRVPITAVAPGATRVHASLNDTILDSAVAVVAKARLSSASVATAMVEAGGIATVNVSVDAIVAAPTSVEVTSSNSAVVASMTIVIPAGLNAASQRVPVLAAGAATLHCTLAESSADVGIVSVATASMVSLWFSNDLRLGAPNTVELSFDVAASKPHAVVLSSSDPTIVSVPPEATLETNASSISIPINVLKKGSAIITALSSGQTLTLIADVNDVSSESLQIYGETLSVGAVGTLQFYGAGRGTLTLTSSDPSVIAVPSAKPVSHSASQQITGLRAGKTVITADFEGQSSSVELVVLERPGFQSFGPQFTVEPGGTLRLSFGLTAVATQGSVVTFSSSNPAVASAPSSIAVGHSTYLSAQIRGLTTGTTVLTATLGSVSASAVVYVGSPSSSYVILQNFNAYWGSTLEVGAVTIAQASLSGPATTEPAISVEYSAPGIVETVGTIGPVPLGQYSSYFPIRGLSAGTVDVTITRDGSSQTRSFTVVETPTFSLYGPTTVEVGHTVSWTAQADCVLSANVVLPVLSATPASATVSLNSVTLTPGQSGVSASFAVRGVAVGTSTITIGTGPSARNATVTVTP